MFDTQLTTYMKPVVDKKPNEFFLIVADHVIINVVVGETNIRGI